MAEQPARPPVITWCAWLIMLGAGFVVLLAYQHVADLGSLESQEQARRLLADPPFSGIGLGVDDVQRIEQVLALVAGGAAAAAAILGFEVLRNRSRTARRVLTVLAPLLFFAGTVVGGFIAFTVVAAILLLWSPTARPWFGDPAPETPGTPARPDPFARPTAPTAGAGPAGQEPQPQRTGPDPRAAVLVPPAPGAVVRRPGAVVMACVVTWISSGLVALAALASGALVIASPDELVDELRRQNPQLADQGVGEGFLVAVIVATVVGLVLWCVTAAVLALLTLRGHRWAVITLIVSGGTAGALCLVSAVLGAVVAAVPFAACVAAALLLNRPESRTWFRAER